MTGHEGVTVTMTRRRGRGRAALVSGLLLGGLLLAGCSGGGSDSAEEGFVGAEPGVAIAPEAVEIEGWAELVEAITMHEGEPVAGVTLAVANEADRAFEKKPHCTECHEEELYPEYLPGEKVVGRIAEVRGLETARELPPTTVRHSGWPDTCSRPRSRDSPCSMMASSTAPDRVSTATRS